MNLPERSAELVKARALKDQIAQAEARLDATDGEEGALKDALREAHQECDALIRVGERNPRVGVLFTLIHELQEKLRAITHEPSTLQNTLRRLGSDFEGFRSRDWWWLKEWRIGREPGMGSAVDVENPMDCEHWLSGVRTHANVFLAGAEADAYVAECEGEAHAPPQRARRGPCQECRGRCLRRSPARRTRGGEGAACGRESRSAS